MMKAGFDFLFLPKIGRERIFYEVAQIIGNDYGIDGLDVHEEAFSINQSLARVIVCQREGNGQIADEGSTPEDGPFGIFGEEQGLFGGVLGEADKDNLIHYDEGSASF